VRSEKKQIRSNRITSTITVNVDYTRKLETQILLQLGCRSEFVVHSFVSGSHTEAELSAVNILSECLMLRDNLLFFFC